MKEIYHCFRKQILYQRAKWLSQYIQSLLGAKILYVNEVGSVLVYF